jgi:hypothetical protein
LDTSLTLGQVIGLITAIIGPLLTGFGILFWQLRGQTNRTIQILEDALTKSENQAETLLPLIQQQVVAVDTTLTLLRRDIEELRTDVRRLQQTDMRRGPP